MNKFIILTNYKTLEKVAIPFEEIMSIARCEDDEKRNYTRVILANKDYADVEEGVQGIVSEIHALRRENLHMKTHLGIKNKS